MLNYSDGYTIPKWFGDFGGNFCVNDTDFARLSHPIKDYERILSSDDFERSFRDVLSDIVPCAITTKTAKVNGTEFKIAPALARYYNLSGHLCLAVMSGAEQVFVGTYDAEMAMCAAKESGRLGLKLRVALSRRLTKDDALVEALRALNAHVDTKAVFDGFDLPYGQEEAPFGRDSKLYPVPITANYGVFPKPGLSGIFAGLYGADLMEALGENVGCIAAPTDTGLEALGVFKAYKHTDASLCTCEAVIACEYHGCDTGTYTLIKKYADQADINVSICPELAALWRSGRVARLGCDRVAEVDTEPYRKAGLSEPSSRAASLALEKYSDVVVLEKEVSEWNA